MLIRGLHTDSGIRRPAVVRCRRHCCRGVVGAVKSVSSHGGRPLSIGRRHTSDQLPGVSRRRRWLSDVVETAVRLRRLEDGRHGVRRLIAMRSVRMMMMLLIVAVALIQRLTVRAVVPEVRRHRVVHLHHVRCLTLQDNISRRRRQSHAATH